MLLLRAARCCCCSRLLVASYYVWLSFRWATMVVGRSALIWRRTVRACSSSPGIKGRRRAVAVGAAASRQQQQRPSNQLQRPPSQQGQDRTERGGGLNRSTSHLRLLLPHLSWLPPPFAASGPCAAPPASLYHHPLGSLLLVRRAPSRTHRHVPPPAPPLRQRPCPYPQDRRLEAQRDLVRVVQLRPLVQRHRLRRRRSDRHR